jgi:hypothetical protein
MAQRTLMEYICIDCNNGFISSIRNLTKRSVNPGIVRCNSCHEPWQRKSQVKKTIGKTRPTPHKMVKTLEQAKSVLTPNSIRKVWAKCEKCHKGFRQQYIHLYPKVQRGHITCTKCEYAYSGLQKTARQKFLWHSDLYPYVEANKPFPLDLAILHAGKKSQYPIVFDCKTCGKEEIFQGIGSLRSRQHYKDEPICKSCYYKTPEYIKCKSNNYTKRLDRPLAKRPRSGVYHSKWGDIVFDSLQGELSYLLEIEKNEMVSYVSRATTPIEYEYKNAKHRYYPDFFITYRDRDPQIIEIKGWNRVPEITKAKLDAAEIWCKTMGFRYKFISSISINKAMPDTVSDLVAAGKITFTDRDYNQNMENKMKVQKVIQEISLMDYSETSTLCMRFTFIRPKLMSDKKAMEIIENNIDEFIKPTNCLYPNNPKYTISKIDTFPDRFIIADINRE